MSPISQLGQEVFVLEQTNNKMCLPLLENNKQIIFLLRKIEIKHEARGMRAQNIENRQQSIICKKKCLSTKVTTLQ